MPNQRDPSKSYIGFFIDAFAHEKFKKRAAELNMPVTEILIAYINSQVSNITLTQAENEKVLQKIAARIRKA